MCIRIACSMATMELVTISSMPSHCWLNVLAARNDNANVIALVLTGFWPELCKRLAPF
jgi:hypothetical protein